MILIADDNDDMRTLMKEWLRRSGYVSIEAENGQEAIEITNRDQPDLILMDLQMPILDGLNAAKQIRHHEQSRNIPIIFFTAYGIDGMEVFLQIDSLGGAPIEYLTKPVDPDELMSAVKRLLSLE